MYEGGARDTKIYEVTRKYNGESIRECALSNSVQESAAESALLDFVLETVLQEMFSRK